MHKSSFLRTFQRHFGSIAKNKNKANTTIDKADVQKHSQLGWSPEGSRRTLHSMKLLRTTVQRNFVMASKNQNQSNTTVDKEDVQRHSQLANDWWNPDGPQRALHSMNLLRVPLIRDGLVECSTHERNCSPLRNQNILDVGCGGGILSEPLARLGGNVTGIDASKELIDIAVDHSCKNPRLSNNKPTYICTTIEDHIKNYSNHYDGVVASEVIEHVNNKEVFVKSCIEALKPGGRIFFTTPNRTRISQILSICVAEYVLNLVPRGTHEFDKFVTPNELTFLLERNNCHVELIYGLMYYFLPNKWEFIKSQALMFALQAVKIN